VSDIEDYTSYDDVYQTIRTNTAESDFITRIFGYFRGSVIVFKSESIHQVFFQPTYPFTVSSRRVSGDLGSYGTNMPVMIGGDVIFYSPPNGFYRLSQVDQENTFSLPVSISDQIQDTIDNINVPTTVIFGCSAVLDRYAFFGVSIGVGATALNAVLVFNTQTNQWESAPDTWRDPAFGFNALHVVNYQGVKRLFAIDYANGAVYLMYEGINDELVSGSWTVPFKLETRGYNAQDQVSWKRFFRTKLAISTYAPSITLTAINEGFNEEKLLTPTPIEKSRLKFYTEGHADYNPLTDDATEPKRKDYSLIDFSELAIEDFEELPDGPLSVLPGTPTVTPGDKQQSLERYTVNTNGRWCSLRIENDQGSCDLLSVTMEGNAIQDTRRTAA
jgi:hypothetical protein